MSQWRITCLTAHAAAALLGCREVPTACAPGRGGCCSAIFAQGRHSHALPASYDYAAIMQPMTPALPVTNEKLTISNSMCNRMSRRKAYQAEIYSALQLEIRGVDGELRKAAEAALSMKPNFAYTLKEVKADMHHVFDLGYFSKATPTPEDTRDGVKLIIEVFPFLSSIILFERISPIDADAGDTRGGVKFIIEVGFLCHLFPSSLLRCFICFRATPTPEDMRCGVKLIV